MKKIINHKSSFINRFRRRRLIIDILGALLVGLVAVGIFSYFSKSASASWFDENWLYRKAITVTVTSSSSDVTNLDTSITVDTTGITAKLQTNCEDLRFTSTGGKLLPYYAPSCSDNSATNKIWVQVDLVPKNTTTYTMYMYYGNPTAPSKSDSVKFNLYNGLQGYWPMNEGSANTCSGGVNDSCDVSGNTNNGAWNGSAANTTGKFSNGVNFTGGTLGVSGDYISLSNSSALSPESGSFSVSIWFKTSTNYPNGDNGSGWIYGDYGTDTNNLVALYIDGSNSNKIAGYYRDGSANAISVTNQGSAMNDGNWHHAVWVKNGTTGQMYIDGSLIGSNTNASIGAVSVNSGNAPRISAYPLNFDEFFIGQLDDFRAYNRALSASDITQLYNDSTSSILTAGSGPASTSFASEEQGPGPVAYWQFDDSQGQTTQDSSSSNNDGTLGANSGSSTDDPTWTTEDQCVSGKCLKFDGGDYVTIGTGLNAQLVRSKAFTLGSWIKTNSASNQAIIDSADWSDPYVGIEFMVNSSGNLRFDLVQSGSQLIRKTTSSTVNDGKWHYVSATYSGSGAASGVTIYIDGKSVSATTNYDTLAADATSTTNLQVGARDGANTPFSGFIDEPKIYPYARSAAQVKSDYDSRGSKSGSSAEIGSSISDYLSNGLVGYWKMDEASANSCSGGVNDSCDSSGNSLDGAWAGNATAAAGKFGNGVTFDGSGDYISRTDNALLDLSGNFTLSTWIKPNSNPTDSQGILSKGSHTGLENNFNLLYWGGNALYLTWSTGASGVYDSLSFTQGTSTGTWYHLVATFEGNQVRVYVNGVLKNSKTTTVTALENNAEDFLIGTFATNNYFFNGVIDDARVYNRTLSPKEVSDLYNWAPGPVGHWNFEEGTGTSANDTSSNANTGTLGGDGSGTDLPSWNNGKYGKGLRFDGTDDYIDAGSGSSVSFTTQDVTVTGWFKTTSASSQYLVGKYKTTDVGGYLVYMNAGKLKVFVETTSISNYADIQSTSTFNDGKWHHFAALIQKNSSGNYTTSSMQVYVDGNLAATSSNQSAGTVNNLTCAATCNLSIGSSSVPDSYFNGSLDDIKIYNYARTQKQIVSDMNAGHPAVGSPVGSAVGYWKFDEGSDNKCSGGTNDTCNSGSAGSTLDGAQSGMAVPATSTSGWTNSGKFGKALLFDGSNDYVAISASAPLNVNSITFSSWVYPTSLANDWNAVAEYNNGTNIGVHVYVLGTGNSPASGIYVNYVDASGNSHVYCSPANVITANQWNHIAVTMDGATQAMYVNGRAVTSTLCSGTALAAGTTLQTTYALNLGKRVSGASPLPFTGTMDEVKLYNYALTSDEVKVDYNRGQSMVLGAAGTNSTYEKQAANQEYCIPGDSTSCAAPVAEWRFEEGSGGTVNDTTGRGNSGTISEATYTNGIKGKALLFDGVNDYVNFGNKSDFDVGTAATYEAWIYPTAAQTSWIFAKWASGSEDKQLQFDSSGQIKFYLHNAFSGTYLDSGTTAPLNQWSHVAAVYNGSIATIYINGKYANSKAASGNIGDSTGDLYVGYRAVDGGPFKGKIDQFRIFNYARSAAQVAWDYNRGKPVGHWKLDECQGTVANDSSGNSNTGTITIGASGTQTAVGTCTGSANTAWKDGATGKRNASLDFDGTDDYVSLGTPSNFNFSAPATISTWVKSTSDTNQTILATSKSTTSDNYQLLYLGPSTSYCTNELITIARRVDNSEIYVLCYNTTNRTELLDGNWHQITVTFDGSTVILYLDGKQKTLTVGTGNNNGTYGGITGVNDASIGSIIVGSSRSGYANGQIDDVKIFNYALTATQVKDVYNNGAINFGPSTGSP